MSTQPGNGKLSSRIAQSSNGSTRKRKPTLIHKRWFKEPPQNGQLDEVRISDEIEQLMEVQRPRLEIPSAELKQLSHSASGDSADMVRNYADNFFLSDPLRAKILAVCKGLRAGFKEKLKTEESMRKKWNDVRLNSELLHRRRSRNVPETFAKHNLLALGKTVLFGLVWVMALIAEFVNVMYLVMNAGLGFEASYFSAACFGGIYVLAPFVMAEFLTHDLSVKQKCQWAFYVKLIALPLVVAGMMLFAWKMGAMNDSSFNAFADASLQPWEPKLWLTLFVSMLLLTITVMAVPSLIDKPISTLFPFEWVNNPLHIIASKRVIAANAMFAEVAGDLVRIESCLMALDNEREEFASRCLAAYQLFEAESKARLAIARIEITKS